MIAAVPPATSLLAGSIKNCSTTHDKTRRSSTGTLVDEDRNNVGGDPPSDRASFLATLLTLARKHTLRATEAYVYIAQ